MCDVRFNSENNNLVKCAMYRGTGRFIVVYRTSNSSHINVFLNETFAITQYFAVRQVEIQSLSGLSIPIKLCGK